MASIAGRALRGLVFVLDLEWPALEASEDLEAAASTEAAAFTVVGEAAVSTAVGEAVAATAAANAKRVKTCGAAAVGQEKFVTGEQERR